MSNNPPYSTIDLTQSEHEMLARVMDRNYTVALTLLSDQNLSEASSRAIVELMEEFKSVAGKLKIAAS